MKAFKHFFLPLKNEHILDDVIHLNCIKLFLHLIDYKMLIKFGHSKFIILFFQIET